MKHFDVHIKVSNGEDFETLDFEYEPDRDENITDYLDRICDLLEVW